MRQKSPITRGSALASTLTVIGIIAVVVLFVVLTTPRRPRRHRPSTKDLIWPRAAAVDDAIGRFYVDCGRYPTNSEGLGVLLANPGGIKDWNGPYVKQSQLLDPWGNRFVYEVQDTANSASFDLVCLGADGAKGGDGESADMTYQLGQKKEGLASR